MDSFEPRKGENGITLIMYSNVRFENAFLSFYKHCRIIFNGISNVNNILVKI